MKLKKIIFFFMKTKKTNYDRNYKVCLGILMNFVYLVFN